jgi:hypothetical protein
VINLEFKFENGSSTMRYDVHPASQETPIEIPTGAVSVVVWLGTQ